MLDAIRRNLDRLAGLPDFFDLLTETAATSQSMFSFLAQEVRERKNLGILCHSLPLAARRLGFDWTFEGVELHRVFQARVFDNRRTLPDERWYESASRFNSQIPLEYAYGAWGKLPEPTTTATRGCSSRSGSRASSCFSSRERGCTRCGTSRSRSR